MSLRFRLALLSLFFIGSIGAVSAIGYFGSTDLVRSLDRVATVQLPAVRAMTLIDMMHDGLRAVAYRALYLSTGAIDPKESDEVRA